MLTIYINRYPSPFLLTPYLFLTLIPFIGTVSAQPSSTQKPNILLIVADDLGYEKVGAYHGLASFTPQLDQMAKKGVLFESAYTSPVCTPSRMSIYTGTYPTTHQYTDVLPVHIGSREWVDFEHWNSYAQLFREQGYLTAVTGKWQLAAIEFYPEHIRTAGFDSWCVWQIWKGGAKTTRYWNPTYNQDGKMLTDIGERFGTDVMTEYVIEKMKQAKERNQPFCIQHNMCLPHVPIVQTPVDKAMGREGSLDHMIAYMDQQVGHLLDALTDLEIEEQTLVIFMGDNGTESTLARKTVKGEVEGGKWGLNDGGTHIPMIACWPTHIQAGRTIADLVESTDLFPTLCDVGQLDIPQPVGARLEGISFFELLMGRGTGKRKWVTAGVKGNYSLFDGQWRYLYKEDQLIDARQLPREQPADLTTMEAQEAKERLRGVLESLLDKH